ncbi:MAG: hypothetical protein KatS3mg059_1167 [Thermomicrobiales bacterium]|nr:MAG: hypothetical protein KatS3mg059_1167 [Thermomicrobiales bacterium]
MAYDPGEPPLSQPDGDTVLVLHDLLADRSSLGALQEAFSAHHRVIVPDARGHGASASLANQWYTIGELSADASAILDAEGITSCHVLGHGLGGAIAIELARREPGRVRSLVLIEPSVFAVLESHPDPAVRARHRERREHDRTAGDLAYKGLTEKALDAYLTPRWGDGWRSRLTRPQIAALYRHAGALAALLPALDAYDFSPASAAEVPVLTLVIAGEGDSLLAHAARRLAALLPNAEFVRLPEVVTFQPRNGTALAAAVDAIERFWGLGARS